MNINELKNILDKNNVNPSYYCLNPGGYIDNKLSIINEGKKWTVFVMDRGEFTVRETFYNEHDACECLLNKLKGRVRRNIIEDI